MALISDWIQLGKDVFYRKPELYNMEWGTGMDLKDFKIAAAPLGGPIALTRCENMHKSSKSAKGIFFVFSSSGSKISMFKWTGGILLHIDWTRNEELLCIQEDGVILIYDMFGNQVRTFNMGQEVKDTRIAHASVFAGVHDTGIAVITQSSRVFVVNNIQEPKPRKYSELVSNIVDFPIDCWLPIREDNATSIIVSQGNQILSLNQQEHDPQVMSPEWSESNPKVVAMCVSSNYRHISMFSLCGNVWLGSVDLSVKYNEIKAKSAVKPIKMAWCGSAAVILLWEMTVELISINAGSTSIYLDSASFLVQEIDSVRIISSTTHDLVQKVPRVLVETLGIGSMSPGALLFEASQGYQEASTRATDCLSMIKDSLEDAVMHCLYSAQFEYNKTTQKALLRAAFFGKSFLPKLDSSLCRVITTTLRILNAIRDEKVGIPLTWHQLDFLTIPILLDRLVVRRLFPLALRMAAYLKFNESEARILAHWACYKVKSPSQKDDEQIALEINQRLGYTPGISYTDIANKADQVGRRQLAIKLLEYECHPHRQVPVLLKLSDDTTALKRALGSGDSDLIYTVLAHLRNKLNLADFLMLIRSFPDAQSLYISKCRASDHAQLREIFIQEDDFQNQALLRIKEAYEAKRIDTLLASLQGASESFRKAKNEAASYLTDDKIKLIRCQIKLEDNHNRPFTQFSLHQSLSQLIKDGHLKEAEKLRSDFKVTDRRFYYLRALAYAEASQWNQLTALSSVKKLTIGMEAFVDVCLKCGNTTEAKKYLSKVKEENKVSYYVKCGFLEEAAKMAVESRLHANLAIVAASCGPQHSALLSTLQQKMSEPGLK